MNVGYKNQRITWFGLKGVPLPKNDGGSLGIP